MKKVLLLGATGHLGKVLLELLLEKEYSVTVLVRSPQKITTPDKNLKIIQGQATDKNDLTNALVGIDVVVSVLGHGFRTKFPVQEKTMSNLIPLMKKNKIKRLITVTGAGLKVRGDPKSLTADFSEKILRIVDPYRIQDAEKQQELLEKSNLEWTVVRTPVHNSAVNQEISKVGFSQPPPWKTISRIVISKYICDCFDKNEWIKKSPIIY